MARLNSAHSSGAETIDRASQYKHSHTRSNEFMSSLLALSNSLADIVDRVGKTIVAINTGQRVSPSGIHWRNGIVITSDESLQHHEDTTITHANGLVAPVTLLGRDATTDVAVFQLLQTDIPVAAIGNTAELKVGHLVMALARSREGDVRAAMGTVSTITGSWQSMSGGTIDRYIRPDLSLYPGFAGGALVDAAGQIVGMNTAGRRGTALTIPAETIDRVVEQLITTGHIARGYLGVGMQPVRLPQNLCTALNLTTSVGVLVVNVEPDSPADRAGLLLGDVLVALAGVNIGDPGDVRGILNQPDRIGKTIPIQAIRGGELVESTVTIGERAV
jgi:S1-C subfamily serine protease